MLKIDKIVCPTDFSEPSYKALKIADELAANFAAELIVVHVMAPAQYFPAASSVSPIAPVPGDTFAADLQSRIKENALKSLEMVLKERVSGDISSRSLFLQGNPADEIVECAKESNASLIVMGTHGFTGWKHLLLGSVTEKVVRSASCPVLTIPAFEKE